MKKKLSSLKKDKKMIAIIALVVVNIALAITCYIVYNTHYLAVPSQADLQKAVDSTYENVSNFECKYYGRFNHGKMTYKYNCSFNTTQDDKEYEDEKTCVDCIIKGKKWQCSVGASKCFK